MIIKYIVQVFLHVVNISLAMIKLYPSWDERLEYQNLPTLHRYWHNKVFEETSIYSVQVLECLKCFGLNTKLVRVHCVYVDSCISAHLPIHCNRQGMLLLLHHTVR